jgi:hypothetical protein
LRPKKSLTETTYGNPFSETNHNEEKDCDPKKA